MNKLALSISNSLVLGITSALAVVFGREFKGSANHNELRLETKPDKRKARKHSATGTRGVEAAAALVKLTPFLSALMAFMKGCNPKVAIGIAGVTAVVLIIWLLSKG